MLVVISSNSYTWKCRVACRAPLGNLMGTLREWIPKEKKDEAANSQSREPGDILWISSCCAASKVAVPQRRVCLAGQWGGGWEEDLGEAANETGGTRAQPGLMPMNYTTLDLVYDSPKQPAVLRRCNALAWRPGVSRVRLSSLVSSGILERMRLLVASD
jgi:hypothetical protein